MISNCESLSSSGDKKSVRFVLVTYLTLLAFELAYSVKISNFEAHADMNIIHLI